MFSALLIGRKDWFSRRCALTWRLKGTKYNRLYFQLQASTRRTSDTEYGLLLTPGLVEIAETPEEYQARQRKRTEAGLNQAPHPGNKYNCLTSQVLYSGMLGTPRAQEKPRSEKFLEKDKGIKRVPTPSEFAQMLLKTPSAMDAYAENLTKKEQTFGNSGTLAQEIQSGFVEKRWPALLPTPTAVQREHPERVESLKATGAQTMFSRANGENRPNSIIDHLHFHGMLPTPMASDCGEKVTGLETQDSLVKITRGITGKPSQLNPRFVAEMMGFPPNWTELPFQSGDRNQSRDTETP
jgi:hypothetical protein